MIGKRGLFAIARVIALVTSVCCTSATAGIDKRVENLHDSHAMATWQEYAIYLIAHELCGSATGGNDKLWPKYVCASALAELANNPELYPPQDYPLYAFENSSSQNAFVTSDAGGANLDVLPMDAGFEILKGYDDTKPSPSYISRPALGPHAESAVSKSVGRTAIPGPLLLTILALIGLVAVARRDVSEKVSTYLPHGTNSEVATLNPLRHNSSIIGGNTR
jgi:hypothetical protein